MTDIDWSKAPEGWKLVPINPTPEMRSAAGAAECMAVRERRQFFAGDSWRHMVNNAPEYCAPEWSGEGLPPVGTVCEWAHAGQWLKVEVAYLSEWLIVLRGTRKAESGLIDSEGVEIAIDHWKEDAPVFRPIRTPEQIAAEEREKEVDQMVQRIAENTTGIGIGAAMICAKALHAAGYRKVTP